MREIVLDTETTGFDPEKGDRIVEIGAVELINHVATGRTYHQYINPERDMPAGAFKIHGLSEDFLAQYPTFAEVAAGFLDFAGDAAFVIHNAEFDMKFLNAEYSALGFPRFPMERAIDTLAIARKRFPGAGNTLDQLCKRFNIDASNRELHGALIDSYLLAEVYLELIGGREPGFLLGTDDDAAQGEGRAQLVRRARRPKPLPPRLTAEEAQAHERFLKEKLKGEALWITGKAGG